VGQQLVLHVLMQVAVLGDEIIMEINSPLHISIMHCNNYSVKFIWLSSTDQRGRRMGTLNRSSNRDSYNSFSR